MSNEVIGKKERVILVQQNVKSGEEKALYKDEYGGGFQPTSNVSSATTFESAEAAKKIAETLNMLYSMTGNTFKASAANETIERKLLDEKLTHHEEEADSDDSPQETE